MDESTVIAPTVIAPTQLYHALLYGDPSGGKSHMAASAVLPQVILLTDGLGKARPYLNGMVAQRRTMTIKIGSTDTELETVRVFHPSDTKRENMQRLLFSFVDKNSRSPVAYKQFESLFPIIDTYVTGIKGRTLVVDSITTFNILYRNYMAKELNAQNGFASEWDWSNPLTRRTEQICMELIAKPYNTILIAHVSVDNKTNVHGFNEYVASFSGRMAKLGLAIHDNTYRLYVDTEGKNWCQTVNDGRYVAYNNFDAPAKCTNDFTEVMKNQKQIMWE